MKPAGRAAWRDWQVPATQRGAPFRLARLDTAAQPLSLGAHELDKEAAATLAEEIGELQAVFRADRRFKLLVVLQGVDAAGKDGTIAHVFGRLNPLGVRATSWRAPTPDELAHDHLWRFHAQMPAAGEFALFNRSHYEEVLVPVVEQQITRAQTRQRFRQINDFERLLAETGTVILKFMLHIGFDEQRERLQERIDEPDKRWKHDPRDWEVREQWEAYRRAYEAMLGATSTAWAPWVVVPADSKPHRNLMVATIVRDTLRALKLRHPQPAQRG
jgi:PPK2 family polyphosphate:nucleotide phosphotransferase